MVYKVAVVDDESNVVEQICEWLEEYGKSEGREFVVDKFSGTTQFMNGDPGDYNIIFMDINLPHEENGMKVARRLRENKSKAVIIFCTNYPQYAINGWETQSDWIAGKVVHWRHQNKANVCYVDGHIGQTGRAEWRQFRQQVQRQHWACGFASV